ncbi:hypothetical protein [Neobacillus cucumis]|uniref:hypothetical protein n=1 Tax=Neobacillus cucumis TaxID=1740721 RepID=UPI0028533B89|nr:hypothetical protein [Neobacillus cucumis]MDR4947716.1 hypothetical protein [Neobacillus cucumis]
MADEPQEQPQEQEKEELQETSQTLKEEIKTELKMEMKNFHQKRKRRIIKSVCIFALGLLIGFGGGRATHTEHHFEHGHFQKWHQYQQ